MSKTTQANDATPEPNPEAPPPPAGTEPREAAGAEPPQTIATTTEQYAPDGAETIESEPVELAPARRRHLAWLWAIPARLLARLLIPSNSFWILFVLIVLGGGALRTIRMDMPPFDFPADRQYTNMFHTELLRQPGVSLLSMRNTWMELRILPWITARTSFLCDRFHCQLYTLARFWSILFGIFTFTLAALAGYQAAGVPDATRAQRRRIALFWMAILAFNPYHIQLSRMIMTESFTLAMQMGAVTFFWLAYRNARNLFYFAMFVVFFVLAGWGKIPSMIWLPGFAIYLIMHPVLRGRAGKVAFWGALAALAAFVLGVLVIFWMSQVNPLKLVSQYAQSYAYFAQHTRLWMGSPLWTKTYLSRLALMLTLPGLLLAIVGLLSAPWLFRITTAVFLVVFYGLVNLNNYNFCHLLIPGTALAAWGANSFVEAASSETAASIFRRWSEGLDRWQKRLNQAVGLAIAVFLVVWLYPLGPTPGDPHPRGEVLQAVEVIRKLVPAGTTVCHDDPENSLSYALKQADTSKVDDRLDLRTGYYYLFERFSDRPLQYAAAAWVKWASLPGEPGGILLTRTPAEPTSATKANYLAVPRVKPTPVPTATPAPRPGAPTPTPAPTPPPAPPAQPPLTLEAATLYLPAGPYDAARQTLLVHPGKPVTFGVTWKNPRNFPLAALRWKSERWGQNVAVPVREGGLAMAGGALLCLPDGNPVTAFYTFEIPPGFPTGSYTLDYYPHSPGPWHEPEQGVDTLPFRIICDADSVPPETIDVDWRQLYPARYSSAPWLWSDKWWYRDMRLEGYRLGGVTETYFLSCPMRQPGQYEVKIRGEAEPLTGNTDPDNLWPTVEIYLPGDLTAPIARVRIDSRQTGEFKASFTAMQAFDGLMIKAIADSGAETPMWMNDFSPAKCGKQVLNLRGLRLAPERKILPGMIDALNAPPGAKGKK